MCIDYLHEMHLTWPIVVNVFSRRYQSFYITAMTSLLSRYKRTIGFRSFFIQSIIDSVDSAGARILAGLAASSHFIFHVTCPD